MRTSGLPWIINGQMEMSSRSNDQGERKAKGTRESPPLPVLHVHDLVKLCNTSVETKVRNRKEKEHALLLGSA